MSNFTLIGTDEVSLNVNDYLVENMKGIILCIHGMSEHSKRYKDFALYLNKNGFSVYAYDHRGHGDSCLEGENLGYQGIDGFNKMIYDMDIVINYIKEKYPQEKIYLIGHSMGSFVVERYIQLYNKVDGVVLSGSNYGKNSLRLGIFISKIACLVKGEKTKGKLLEKLTFGSYNKCFCPIRTSFDWLSRSERAVDAYIADSMCGFTCSNLFYYNFIRGILELSKRKNFKNIDKTLPIFIISGEKDPVGNNGKGVKALYKILHDNLENVEYKLYKDARHEIFNETNLEEVYKDVLKWLEKVSK